MDMDTVYMPLMGGESPTLNSSLPIDRYRSFSHTARNESLGARHVYFGHRSILGIFREYACASTVYSANGKKDKGKLQSLLVSCYSLGPSLVSQSLSNLSS